MSYLMRLNNGKNLQKLIALGPNSFSRLISNSSKNRTTTSPVMSSPPSAQVSGVRPWLSHGYDFKDKSTDRDASRSSFFFSVTLCLIWGGFFWIYLPDPQGRDWAQREAFIELKRREACGCSLIDPNFIDPEEISLPSEDDLCGVEIII